MTPRPVLLEETAPPVHDVGAPDPVFLADLGFPCHLECAPCRRQRRPSPREWVAGIQDLTRAAGALGPHPLRVVFFGGDPFARPNVLERPLVAVNGAARAAGVPFVAAAISDGTSWDAPTLLRFFELGVRAYQVQLDGPACLRDLLPPAPYPREARELACVLDALHRRGDDSSHFEHTAVSA